MQNNVMFEQEGMVALMLDTENLYLKLEITRNIKNVFKEFRFKK
mgnify:CR=1 FL=1